MAIDKLELIPLSGDGAKAVEEVFAEIGRDRQAAAGKTLAYLRAKGSAEDFLAAARRLVLVKGNDPHDYKFSVAALEDYYHVSPACAIAFWRPACFSCAARQGKTTRSSIGSGPPSRDETGLLFKGCLLREGRNGNNAVLSGVSFNARDGVRGWDSRLVGGRCNGSLSLARAGTGRVLANRPGKRMGVGVHHRRVDRHDRGVGRVDLVVDPNCPVSETSGPVPARVAHGQRQHQEVVQEIAEDQPAGDPQQRAAQLGLPPDQRHDHK